jgi:hypothetical protein
LKKIEKGKLRKINILYYNIKQRKEYMTVKYVTTRYYSFYKVPILKYG